MDRRSSLRKTFKEIKMKTSVSVLGLLPVFVAVGSVSLGRAIQQDWELFKATYNKPYSTEDEELKRLKICSDNRDFVTKHKKLYVEGKVRYSVALNQFSDWTENEIEESLLNCIEYSRADAFLFNESTRQDEEQEEEDDYDDNEDVNVNNNDNYSDDDDDDDDDSKLSEKEVNWVKKKAPEQALKTREVADPVTHSPLFDTKKATAKCTGYEESDDGCLRKMVTEMGPVSVGIYGKRTGIHNVQKWDIPKFFLSSS